MLISAFLSFITSGVVNILEAENIISYNIPISLYFLGYSIINLIIFKIYFREIKFFKISVYKKIIKLTRLFNKIENKVNSVDDLNDLQKNAIKLWVTLLKNPYVKLHSHLSNPSSLTRVIEKGSTLIILKQNQNEYNFTIMDSNNIFYEVYIPNNQIENVCELFDDECLRRINIIQSSKKEILNDIIRKLTSV